MHNIAKGLRWNIRGPGMNSVLHITIDYSVTPFTWSPMGTRVLK